MGRESLCVVFPRLSLSTLRVRSSGEACPTVSATWEFFNRVLFNCEAPHGRPELVSMKMISTKADKEQRNVT